MKELVDFSMDGTILIYMERLTESQYRHYEALGFTREQIDQDLAKSEYKEMMYDHDES